VLDTEAPYTLADCRGFFLSFPGGKQALWFTMLSDAVELLRIQVRRGWTFEMPAVRAQSCEYKDQEYVWTDRPEWSEAVAEKLKQEFIA
jgi:hypothetical protein